MFSKSTRLSVLIAAFTVSGCGLKMGEKPKEQTVAKISSTTCMKPSLKQLSALFDGNAEDEKLAQSFDCLQSVLTAFKDNMRGKNSNHYTPGEIAGFLKNHILKDDTEFPPELLRAAMKLKVLFVGGNTEFITRDELDATGRFAIKLKPEILRINPHMKVINGKWDSSGLDAKSKEEKFFQAQRDFGISMSRIGAMLSATGRPYESADLLQFVYEVVRMSDGKPDSLKKIEQFRNLFFKYKSSLIGGTSAIVGDEWVRLTSSLSEIYFQSLRVKYFIDPLTAEQSDERLLQFQEIAKDVTALMPQLLAHNGTGLLTNVQISEMLEAAKEIYPELTVSPELVNQIGKLKLVLVGKFGNGSEAWSAADFNTLNGRVSDLFKNLRSAVKDLKQFKTNKTGFKNNEIKLEDFLQAETDLIATVQEFSSKILYGYDLGDLRILATELKPLLKDSIKIPENINDLIDVLIAAKVALTGEAGSQVSIKGLQLLLNQGVRYYGNFIQLNNFVLPFQLYDREFTTQLEPLIMKFRENLALNLKAKDSHLISTEEISVTFMAAQKAKLFETKVTKASVDDALNAVWENILNKPEDRLAGKKLPGFNGDALANLSTEIAFWLDNQKTIFTLFQDRDEYSKEEIVQQLKNLVDQAKSPLTRATLAELYSVVAAPGLLNHNDKDFMRILTAENGRYHAKDLVFSNLSKTLSRVLIRAFSSDADRISNLVGLNNDEAKAAFEKLKGVACELELVDPKTAGTFIDSRFREANLFLAVSNGDDYVDFKELHHIVMHINSGIARGKTFKEVVRQKCLKKDDPVLSGHSELDEQCVIDLIDSETATFLDLPNFLKLRTETNPDGTPKYTPEANKAYYMALLKAAGHVPNDNKTVYQGDALLFPHVVQYIEAIYARHDTSLNSLLEKDEALRAFPIFDNLITMLAKPFTALTHDDMPGVFIYLLKFHRPPKTLAEKLKFAAFVKDHDCSDNKPCQKDWNIESTRHDLGLIFNFIADATKPPTPPTTPPTPAPGG